MSCKIVVRVVAGIILPALFVLGQTDAPVVRATASGAPASGAASAPVYVLYRLFLRHVAAVDAEAAKLDADGKTGGNELRASYQKSLLLTDVQAALLKQSAASCNASLDRQHASALPAISAARAALVNAPPGKVEPSPPSALAAIAALDQARTDISNGCIASLRAALGGRVFANIDVFVRTKFSQKVSKIPPAGAPFSAARPTRLGLVSVTAPSAPGGKK